MQLTRDDAHAFEAACADHRNDSAQELVNATGVAEAQKILAFVVSAPPAVKPDLVRHVWTAIQEQERRRKTTKR